MTGSDFEHLVLAVTVERGPLEDGRFVGRFRRPVEHRILTSLAHDQLATLVRDWEGQNKASDLAERPWSIDMRLEFPTWTAVDIELVELRFDATANAVCNVR